ncbi:unnamed protein product [Paramecium sonneborni]|uniref:Uncharacterized protein n=1 Tax=Paramecium sonneborni TaxID=65129 RepID=A0A8S1QTQ8_9CILI|nr:unnamed protein product [Paramecium sonneborni]
MNQQVSHQTKTSQTQQFLASQFSKLPDKSKLQQLIPVQLHVNCFERKQNEGIDNRQSPPQQQNYCTKPSQKPQQSNHKSNMSLQNKSNSHIESIQEKLSAINHPNKKRDYSPNSDAIRQLLKNTKQDSDINNLLSKKHQVQDQHIISTPITTKYQLKSHSPLDIKESVAQLLQNHFKTDVSSPKGNGSNQKQKNNHFGPYLSIQQQIQQQKLKGHSSTNSLSYGNRNHHQQSLQDTKRSEIVTITPTPKRFTTTSQNTEHSKSKSVVEEQLQCMKIMQFDKENQSHILNLGSPSAFSSSEQTSSIGDSIGMHLQFGVKTLSPFPKPPQQPQRFCIYHKDKKAKYVTEEGNDYLFFCSKCAVKLAGKGMFFTEIAQLKQSTIDSQTFSFQQSSLDSTQRQSSSVDIQFKEREMKVFLALLYQIQNNRQELLNQLSSQGNKLQNYYEKQMNLCRETKQQLSIFLEEIYQRSMNQLSNSKQQTLSFITKLFQQLTTNQLDTKKIQNEIETNWKRVLDNMDMNLFREVMNQHHSKFTKFGEFQQEIQNQYIQLYSMGSMDIQATMSLIAQNFEIVESAIPLISNIQQMNITQPIRTQPTPPKKNEESISHRIKTDFSNQKKHSDAKQQNFCQYFNEKMDINQNAKDNNSRVTPSISSHNKNLYVSFENKEIFMNALETEKNKQTCSEDDNASKQQAIMILQSYKGSHADIEEESLNMSHDSQKSAPHSPASGQTKESVQRINPTQEQEFVTLANNKNETVPKEAFQKQKSTFRTLFENEDSQEPNMQIKKEVTAISPARSEKFKSILNRISNSQSTTQQYYQQILQGHQKVTSETPDTKKQDSLSSNQIKFEVPDTCVKDDAMNLKDTQDIKDSVHQINMCDDQQHLSDYDDEKEIQDTKLRYVYQGDERKEQYQKTLFSSPMFKDH